MKILVCCANGAGTSLMMKLTLEKVIKKMNLKVTNTHHCSLSEGKSSAFTYDVVMCPLNFIDMFKEPIEKGIKVIGLRNILSAAEMEEKLIGAGITAQEN